MVRRGYNTFYYKHLLQKKKVKVFPNLAWVKSQLRVVLQKKVVGSYWTVTVPTKKGCNVQKYVYSPGSVGIVMGSLA
jgi:hypothetical protein